MKFLVALILTALLGYAIVLYTAWWGFTITSLIVALAIHQKPWKAFLSGFIALLLLWGITAFVLDNANNHLLSKKVGQIFGIGGNSFILIIITAFIGALVSGFAALTGSYARKK